ncbi:MAG: hypothetical protein IJ111_08325 [Eggerthellaceae bacterium]|nr:hypothetical protein [Eggerthellaceae bacterium]
MGRGKYRNLFIIGNGFDRWLGLPTSYGEFLKYYRENHIRIAGGLNCPVHTDERGQKITAVELVYGDAFNPSCLPDDFFWAFEDSMRKIDDQVLNAYFGKTHDGLYEMQETVYQAVDILDECFRQWLASVDVGDANPGFAFGDGCYFINFNYTDTLQRRFGIDNVYHIHGSVADGEPLVFGHASHPEMAFPELIEQKIVHHVNGGKSSRLIGSYFVENALYETDKHVMDNVDDLCEFMTLDGLHIEDVENIYVLGWSMAKVDFGYAEFFAEATKAECDFDALSAIGQLRKVSAEESLDEERLMDLIRLNIMYASKHRERELEKPELLFPQGTVLDPEYPAEDAERAVRMRFLLEQSGRTKEVMQDLATIMSGSDEQADACDSMLSLAARLDGGHDARVKNASWHISYHSEADKAHFENVMAKLGVADYSLHGSIEECIAPFSLSVHDSTQNERDNRHAH